MAVLTLDRLSKRYVGGGDFAVSDVSLTVPDGEFMVLLGPSGCGKSSVLRMIAGLEPITSGTIAIDGKVVNEVPAKSRDIAMVFQSYALYPHMDVYRNLAFGLLRRGISRTEADRRVRDAAERLGLTPFLRRKPHALSGGQRQRVALGRAVVRDPKIFLFDEPLSNLDAALRVSTRNQLIRQQHELGTTTVYVTHDQVEAMTMGHRVCIMNKGQVIQVGQPLEVYRKPADTFVARFLGNPPMNLLSARVSEEQGVVALQLGNGTIPISEWPRAVFDAHAGGVTLGVRPEDLYENPPEAIAACALRLPVMVAAVEPLGAETLLLLLLDGSGEELTARTGRDTGLRVGDRTTIALDSSAIHLFDFASGLALSKGSGR